MMLWIVLAAMTALAVGLMLPALLRRRTDAPPRAAYDLRVYRDQLAELERDAARGLIEPAQAEAARVEIGRRLIAAGEAANAPAGSGAAAPKAGRAAAAVVAVVVPLAALSLYLALGSPDLALRDPAAQTAMEGRSTEALVAELGRRLRDRPDDAAGWALYANSLAGLGRYAESLPAFARAFALDADNPELASRYAEAQIVAAGGAVTPAARTTLDTVLALDPAEPRARYYRGLADLQAGNTTAALERWLALEAETAADAPWRGMLDDRIDAAAKAAGIDAQQLAAMRAETAAKAPAAASAMERPQGPTGADVAAAARMSPEERTQMIRGMVEGLAARLERRPDDFDGWMRLGRARSVLGEKDKAAEAYAKAAALRPDDADALSLRLESMADAAPRNAPMPVEIGRLAERILALDPDRRSALWYAGAARAAAGDAKTARAHWERLLAMLDPASAQHAELKKRIEALGAPAQR